VTPRAVTVRNRWSNYAIGGSGAINGPVTLFKDGSGSLTLNNSNGYTGGTFIPRRQGHRHHSSALGRGAVTTTGARANPGRNCTLPARHRGWAVRRHQHAGVGGRQRPTVVVTDALTIAGSDSNHPAGTINLHDNGLVITGATADTAANVAAWIASGNHGGDWLGTGSPVPSWPPTPTY